MFLYPFYITTIYYFINIYKSYRSPASNLWLSKWGQKRRQVHADALHCIDFGHFLKLIRSLHQCFSHKCAGLRMILIVMICHTLAWIVGHQYLVWTRVCLFISSSIYRLTVSVIIALLWNEIICMSLMPNCSEWELCFLLMTCNACLHYSFRLKHCLVKPRKC